MLEWAFHHRGKSSCEMYLALNMNANLVTEGFSIARLAYPHKSSVPVICIQTTEKLVSEPVTFAGMFGTCSAFQKIPPATCS